MKVGGDNGTTLLFGNRSKQTPMALPTYGSDRTGLHGDRDLPTGMQGLRPERGGRPVIKKGQTPLPGSG